MNRGSIPRQITSLQNDRIKAVRALEMRKERRETGLFVAEGASVLISARAQGWVPVTLIYQAEAIETGAQRALLSWASECGAELLEVSQAVLQKLAVKDNPQSMLAVFKQRWVDAPRPGALGSADVWLALEEVRDPGNLGTIIRTVDAVGARGVILAGTCCDPYQRESIRATMGSIFSVPLARMSTDDLLSLQRAWPGDRVGTHLAGGLDYRAGRYRGPVLLVMGREGPGLSDAVAASCNKLVKIPMAGALDSLNLAVATALTLYEIRRNELTI